ncbi:MAG: hypothetical protein AB7Y46_08025 [Armatimonadota bacterium]
MRTVVSAADYPQHAYFSDPMEAPSLEALRKALTAGTGTDSATFTGGRALVVESLEDTLQDTLWGERHIKLFKRLRSEPIYATVDEWVSRSSYGSPWGHAVGETDSPTVTTADLARQVAMVKFYRDKREVSHVMTLTRSIEDAMAEEEVAGTRTLLGRIEEDLFHGNPSVFPYRIQGLENIIFDQGGDLVVDAHGGDVTDAGPFHEIAGTIYNEGGVLDLVFHNPLVQADIDTALQVAQRFVAPLEADGRVRFGASQRALATAYGDIDFEPDRFVRAGWTMRAPDQAVGPDAPGTPTVNSVAGNGGSIYCQQNLPAGNYYVRVSAVCENGESAAAAAQAVTLTAGKAIVINVSAADAKATGFRVYLSAVGAADGSDCRFHGEYQYTATPQNITVDGHYVTGSTTVFCLSAGVAESAIDWRQLLPMIKMDLAVVGPAFPFLLCIYGYLRVMKPNFHGAVRNVIPANVRASGWNPLGAS